MRARPRLVILESPYAGDVERHTAYARACLLDSLQRGEAPLASHLLYTQVLADHEPLERRAGIEAGLAWGVWADATVVYVDCGISDGMREGIARAEADGRIVERRSIGGQWAAELDRARLELLRRQVEVDRCRATSPEYRAALDDAADAARDMRSRLDDALPDYELRDAAALERP